MAERSYPASEASGGQEETPHVQGQGQPGEATSRLKPGVVTLRSHPTPEARAATGSNNPMPKARGGGQEGQSHVQGVVAVRAQEGLEELSQVEGQEGQR